jgi:sec-independent protein translocase protein TatB
MFEVGFSELLVIFALALVVLGPERLPKLAAQVGRWVGRARAMARQFREQLEAEASAIDPGIHTAYTPPPQPESASSAEPAPGPAPEPPAETAPPVNTPTEPSPPTEPAHERGV